MEFRFYSDLPKALTQGEKEKLESDASIRFSQNLRAIMPDVTTASYVFGGNKLPDDAPEAAKELDRQFHSELEAIRSRPTISTDEVTVRDKAVDVLNAKSGSLMTDFSNYLLQLADLYQKIGAEKDSLISAYNIKREQDRQSGLYGEKYFYEMETAFKQKLADLTKQAIDGKAAIETDLSNAVTMFYSLDAKLIDDDTVKLMHTVKLKDSEVNDMISKYSHNPTMLRILSDYCRDNKIKNPELDFYKENRGKELKIFTEFSQVISPIFGDVPSYRAVMLQHLDGQIADFKHRYAEIPVKPLTAE